MSLQINKRQFKKWIAALDSGEYKQDKGQLESQYGYCCLGVGCVVTIPKELISLNDSGCIVGSMPEEQPAAPRWLLAIGENFLIKTGASLMTLNDDRGYTFPEIATLLELVYVHKMLD